MDATQQDNFKSVARRWRLAKAEADTLRQRLRLADDTEAVTIATRAAIARQTVKRYEKRLSELVGGGRAERRYGGTVEVING